MKDVIIGIDLGTTNSAVSVIEGGSPVIIPNSEGTRTTPSIIGFTEDDIKIGNPAKRQAIANSEKTVYAIKRFMGKKYDECLNDIKRVSYKVIRSKNGLPVVKIGDKEYTPQELSAMILQKMKRTAEEYLGRDVKRAVITVPAWFDDAARNATKEAGEIAGLTVERIINEPTAAALNLDIKGDKKIAVFDFGGGTTDLSILDIGDGVYEVKSTCGDVYLGGEDIDNNIVDWLAIEFMKEFPGVDLRKDPQAHQRLKEAAEKAKIELSSSIETEINLPYIMPIDNVPKHLVKKLSRAKLEQMMGDILDKLKNLCIKALKDANMTKEDINDAILVGGSTRIPCVQNLIRDFFGKEPNKSLNPDECVATGAALQGAIITGDITDVLLLDVIPISLGIETLNSVFVKLIESNTTIPTKKSQVFSTASDNQPAVNIHILQGERPMAQHNKSLGNFLLDGILPAPRGIPQIDVTFDVNASGILTVTATDKATGKNQHIRIEGSSNLTDAEKERMVNEAKVNEDADRKEKEKIDKLNMADSMIYNTRKQLKDLGEKLTEGDKTKLNDSIKKLEDDFTNKNVDNIDDHIKEINDLWNEISTRLYSETQSQQSNETPPQSEQPVDDGEPQNVDYETVK